ncbi:MAG: trigger factor [Marinomonas sp.]|jgi:trigger factor|uniref:Trigger factor n=1 Tax=Marinomonas communis TaxID=28254 RepID=A0A4R6XEB3_9GAMM|nr:trigger factor [Marinomonas communis]MAF15564.1 trigger factor [Marinomonas sp.]MEC8081593.1 trigger factor [Pseudomonadota bacterium]MCC4273109.1 trigger factor [Marinomonas communis]RUM53443.1 MAG: trigger factor [Marinomonas sp.]TDR15587.1 trigger factor [Marinomonas communis]
MQVSVETTSPIERVLTISVPAARIDDKVNAEVAKTAKTVRIDGFRKGKVPVSVVKKRFGQSIRMEALEQVMRDAYVEAIQAESINPAGMPAIEPKNIAEGADLEFVAKVEVYPTIELADASKIEVNRVVADVTEADVDTMLETLRKQNAEWSAVEREAKDGDQVTIDFEGFLGEEAFEGGAAQGHKLVLGSNSMIPGFEEGIVGIKAGEERTITVTFPESYQAEHLAGKEASFKITAHEVAEQVLPELNDEFASKFGLETADLASLRAEVQKNMERELSQAVKAKLKNSLFDQLLALNPVDVPASLVEQEVNGLRQQAARQFGNMEGFDPSQLPAELFSEEATKRAKIGLLISEVIQKNELKVEDDRVRAFLEDMAQAYQEPQQVVEFYLNNKEQLAQVQSAVLEEQVVDKLLESAQITEVALSYEDAIKPEAQAAEAEETEEA